MTRHAYGSQNIVTVPRQSGQHTNGVRHVHRLAKNFGSQHHGRIRGKNDLRIRRVNSAGFFFGHPQYIIARNFARSRRLVDIRGSDDKRNSGRCQQLSAPRRSGGKNE